MVYQRAGAQIQYLLVRPKRALEEWVLPKGHIEPGEASEDAARREVLEETGVKGRIITPLGIVQFEARGKAMRVQYFLMEFISRGAAMEQRETRWASYDEALVLLSHESNRELLRSAEGKRRLIAADS
jgi:ADP-ribose pyrophosphatase YjhB (NUDIX family)